MPQVLEREHEIAELEAAAREAAAGTGSVVLVFGEAGIGKSSVINAVRAVLPPQGRLLVGYCDDLATPRTFGPFRDLLGSVGSDLATALREGRDRDRVFDALQAELSWSATTSVLAIEDVHWADDATLDALSYLVRRVANMPAVLVLTYRDEDIDAMHPLQRVLGLAARAPRVRRLKLPRLSQPAVLRLTAPSRLDPREVYEVTGGNPFFVTEILASADVSRVPVTIVDSVTARVQTLDAQTQQALEQLAVIPSTVDRGLLEALLPGGISSIAAAEQRGLLDVSPSRTGFRHELIRRAIADGLPGGRRMELNQRVLNALTAREGTDLSRIMHHAAEAGADDAIIHYGPKAARDAAKVGSHRQAAAHLRLVLERCDRFSEAERADLMSMYAIECHTIGKSQTALLAQRKAIELRRRLGDPLKLGADLRWLSRICWAISETEEMQASADEAIKVLSGAGDDRLLALALSNKSQLHMLARRSEEAIRIGQFAIALARNVDDPAILSHALNNVGSALWHLDSTKGREMVEESLQVALAAGAIDDACRAHVNIICALLEDALPDEASEYLPDALELAGESENLMYFSHFTALRAAIGLATGAWEQAVADAQSSMAAAADAPPTLCPALLAYGRVQIRRGQPDGMALLTEAEKLAHNSRELQYIGPVAGALAEAAWLDGDHAAMRALLEPVYTEAWDSGSVAIRAELGFWLSKAGGKVHHDTASRHPWALLSVGRWQEAASAWQLGGSPYEHALALAESGEPEQMLIALAALDGLGAEPLARRVRAQLRELGVARIPRGPVTRTRINPAGLTDRQLEVARLLGLGMTNGEIAEKLVVSVRTVDNHVAAVFDKLGARTRRDIAARLTELGLSPGEK
ncbi:DNA-binding CsgD family transcriptional regulator/tetratricopeptide (TPR) repeat protein [Kibdelosporangium banguiense]|uniref:DNA-binding CsgD family transcriptional regulator/tetratricopeptide (TPR) repeat protein n=1 Tax=Kibdelosporangium banguiense TaxID=1365924 RepID=A0ABS4TZP7_9PSEU|nr:LuxR family transcriptional regulator [Kibdelosporangium banguiense]MBP2329875.1 DNA-binding CsgD family transcriptional regulator/tetratricopeptide (TPR) repeat protein [Kibdelosporangium banguiense]